MGGLISICSYSFWRRPNDFLSSLTVAVFDPGEIIIIFDIQVFYIIFWLCSYSFQNFPNYLFMQLQFFVFRELILNKYSVGGYSFDHQMLRFPATRSFSAVSFSCFFFFWQDNDG